MLNSKILRCVVWEVCSKSKFVNFPLLCLSHADNPSKSNIKKQEQQKWGKSLQQGNHSRIKMGRGRVKDGAYTEVHNREATYYKATLQSLQLKVLFTVSHFVTLAPLCTVYRHLRKYKKSWILYCHGKISFFGRFKEFLIIGFKQLFYICRLFPYLQYTAHTI